MVALSRTRAVSAWVAYSEGSWLAATRSGARWPTLRVAANQDLDHSQELRTNPDWAPHDALLVLYTLPTLEFTLCVLSAPSAANIPLMNPFTFEVASP